MGRRKNSELTDKQRQILNYIEESILKNGFPPTVREICRDMDIKSTSTVHAHLSAIEQKGYIKRNQSLPRALEVFDERFEKLRRQALSIPESPKSAVDQGIPTSVVSVPLIGQVAAGSPILAEENIQSYFPIPADMIPTGGEVFMLRVKGDSMINVDIQNGDFLLVQRADSAKNGEIAVVLVEDNATVKRFYKEKDHYRLKPENDTMEDIITKEAAIVGKPIGLMRMFSAL